MKYYSQAERDERMIRLHGNKSHALKDEDVQFRCTNSFAVIYADTNNGPLLFDGSGMSDGDRMSLVKSLIMDIQSKSNFSREIVATSGNIYYVY